MLLTARERAALKARAHPLEPVVQVGHAGLTPAVLAEIDRALTSHQLIKIRLGGADRATRATLASDICARTDATEVQQVGRVLVLWRPNRDDAGGPAAVRPEDDED
ncbi:MAG: ribosome assembly RNA-binding protein YhbY [Vicinamibacterales bacterium]